MLILRNFIRRHRWLINSIRFGMRSVAFAVALPFFIMLCIVLFLIEPFHHIRICNVGDVRRFGWLAVIPDYYLRRWAREGKPERTTLILIMHSPDNRPLMDMYKRLLVINESKIVNALLSAVEPLFRRTRFCVDDHHNYHRPQYFGEQVFLRFTDEEERRGREILESMGIGENDWFVCFHAREPEYYQDIKVSEFTQRLHSSRNCSPENYLEAAKIIAERGGFAIRMGAGVRHRLPKPLPPRIIDYAVDHYSPFADIYLCAKTKFFLGNTAGIIVVPSLFAVPTGIANQLPPTATPLGPHDPWIPMLIQDIASEKYLTFEEMMELGLLKGHHTSESLFEITEKQRLRWVENSSKDIADLCLDIFDILDGIEPPPEVRDLQIYFRERYQSEIKNRENLPYISARFAQKYSYLIKP